MASVWGIDIGKAALKAVKLRKTGEGLEIQAIEYVPYPVEEDEDERQEHVSDAVRSFLSKHKLRGEQIVVGIPGLHAFSRFINLPPVDKSKLGMMVRMEAQQQIPFPIQEVNWDFVKIERDYEPGEEVEIGIFATRTELIDGFLGDLKEAGLHPDTITIAPLAVYNFVRANTEDKEGGTVILDMGSEHTDLVIMDGERFWIRNLRIAGNDVTKALAERFKIPFAEAENLKKSSSKSQQSKKIFTSMEPVLKDLVGEIHRSVGFFKSQAEGLDVKRMVLLGDAAKLKGLPKFFQGQLKYDVDRVAALAEDSFLIDEEVDLDQLKNHLLGFGVALGLAIQGIGEARCAINLAPQQLQVQSKLKKKLPLAIVTAGLAWGAFVLSFLHWSAIRDKVYKTESGMKDVQSWSDTQTAAAAAKQQLPPLEKRAEELAAVGQGRTLVAEFINRFRSVLPANNAELPPLSPEDRQKPFPQQLQAWQTKLRDSKTNQKKFWVLDWSLRRKDIKGDGPKPYLCTVKLAMSQADREPTAIRNQINESFVKPLISQLSGEPFWIHNPEKTSPEGFGDVFLSETEEIYQLDPEARTEGRKSFPAIMVTIRFELGLPKPKPKEQPPAEGQPANAGGGE
ncbi:MAG: type IV pilus assembly protein PilM [Planctomycetota bacterium]